MAFLLGVTARRLARRTGRPLVFTYHTRYEKYAHYVPLPERAVAGLAVRLACRFASTSDLVIAPSEHMAATLALRGVRAPVAGVRGFEALERDRHARPRSRLPSGGCGRGSAPPNRHSALAGTA